MKKSLIQILMTGAFALALAGCQSKGEIAVPASELGSNARPGVDLSSPIFKTILSPGETSLDVDWNIPDLGAPDSYTIAYQRGTVAPANCSLGTIVTGLVGTTYTVTGLYPGAEYSFRICSVRAGLTATGNFDIFVTETAHLIFTSKLDYSANLGGLAGADALCEGLATAAGLPGSPWKAILSSSSVDAKDRITIYRAVYNNNKLGRSVHTSDPNDFWVDRVVISLGFDQYGDAIAAGTRAFGNTNSDGTKRDPASAQYCTDWTENMSDAMGFSFYHISPSFILGNWMSQMGSVPMGTDCATTRSVTCINFQ